MRATESTARTVENDETGYIRADPCARELSISAASNEDGDTELHLTVEDRMLNALGVCHGGIIFLLADTALAYAARQRGGMHASAWATVSFVRPAQQGDSLAARARLVQTGDRRSHYDIDVTNHSGQVVALFRGQTVRVEPTSLQAKT